VNHDLSRRLSLFVSLNTLFEFLDQGLGQLGKASLGGAIASVPRGPSTLDAASNSIENVSSDTSLEIRRKN